MQARMIEAAYPGDTAYRAVIDGDKLHLFETESDKSKTITGTAAKRIVRDLDEAASAIHGYDSERIEHVHHWILQRAYSR